MRSTEKKRLLALSQGFRLAGWDLCDPLSPPSPGSVAVTGDCSVSSTETLL